ncbi:hypothetical protein [Sphaerisporangium sp. TRM90804]|uniref:hypothetical protein n=1 Tax=Sphaerisporangium sp. TRM90804 TaxID=3031113 RepID=UPI002446FE3F|nr:hypothetical protein [Sphaerisporangium sp. TRM90804]MDH2426837.1 hypothetical protein [Sphaerisporangium sp. TRM90804]
MRGYIEQEAEHHRYHEVHLSVTFSDPGWGPALHSVTLRATLIAATGSAEQPIAWSMAPARIEDPAQRNVQFEIKPQLKVAGVEASIGALTGSLPKTGTPFLLALRELRSDPRWELKRTRNLPLDGTQRLVLVVRAPKEADTTMAVEVKASTKSSILRRYRALPTPLRLSATL